MKDIGETFCHVSLGTNKLTEAIAFYDAVLATLDIKKTNQYSHAAAYGKGYPSFWIQVPFDKANASVGNGTHIGFKALSETMVDRFYQQAILSGATCEGPPAKRPEYGLAYYGCFVRDLDGHKIEASFWDTELAKKIYAKS